MTSQGFLKCEVFLKYEKKNLFEVPNVVRSLLFVSPYLRTLMHQKYQFCISNNKAFLLTCIKKHLFIGLETSEKDFPILTVKLKMFDYVFYCQILKLASSAQKVPILDYRTGSIL